MDCREFDRWVAEYAEGALDPELAAHMDAHRAVCQSCDELAVMSERVLLALDETPPVKAPAGFSNRVLAAVAMEEKRLAAEQAAYFRMLKRSLTALLILAGFCGTSLYFWIGKAVSQPIENAAASLEGSSLMARCFMFLQSSGQALNKPVAVPGFDSGLPSLYVGAGIVFAGTMLWLWLYQRRAVGCSI